MKRQLTLMKVGGRIIDDADMQQRCLDLFKEIRTPKLLVHGGGIVANQLCHKLGVEPMMLEGRRITDAQTLDIVTMTYAGLINKQITAKLLSKDCRAVGISGIDGMLLESRKRPAEPIDYGFVGDVEHCHSDLLNHLLQERFVPVIAPLSVDRQGQILNTNADTVASVLATSLSQRFQVRLLMIMDHNGVLQDISNPHSHISQLTLSHYQKLRSSGAISGGMLPKLENCFSILEKGVDEIRILSMDGLQRLVAGDRSGLGTRLSLD